MMRLEDKLEREFGVRPKFRIGIHTGPLVVSAEFKAVGDTVNLAARLYPRVSDWRHRRDEALRRLAEWQRAGKIRFKEDVLDGIDECRKSFLRLLHGKNFGKQIVRIN